VTDAASLRAVVLPEAADAIAPDGSEVRLLAATGLGSMAHFTFPAGGYSIPVRHRSVDEVWHFVRGRGEMWRRLGDDSVVVEVHEGVSIALPAGTIFQVRALTDAPLEAIGVTMPPWPGDGEAIRSSGPWPPTLAAGPGLALDDEVQAGETPSDGML
jgi:mannose-6-phosphate isomerase-like protein (cupin superfamily)